MGMAAILSSDLDHLNKLSFPHPKEAPYEIWLQSAQWFQRRCLKKLTYNTHAQIRTTEAYLYYKLTNEPKGLGELIKDALVLKFHITTPPSNCHLKKVYR